MIAGYVCSVDSFSIVGRIEKFQLNDWDVDDYHDHDHGLDDHDLTRNRLGLLRSLGRSVLQIFLFPGSEFIAIIDLMKLIPVVFSVAFP